MTLEEAKIVIEMRTKQFRKQAENEELWPIEKAFNDGVVDGLKIAMDAIEHVDTEPVGNPDKLTLTELARELRKIFKFKYLTVEMAIYNPYFCLWTERPYWNGKYWGAKEDGQKHMVTDFLSFEIVASIDLSEYKDADGNIDYSKCIVEVKE